jgi:pentatricopeptide repeat protein
MPKPVDLAKNFKNFLEEGAVRLRVLRPYLELEGGPLGEKGQKIDAALFEARENFQGLLALRRENPDALKEIHLSDSLLSRMGFNMADCLGRAGHLKESWKIVSLMDNELLGEETLNARALTHFNLFLLTLGMGEYPEAVEEYKRIYAMGDSPIIWRTLAESAFYLCVLSLYEGSQLTAQEVYSSFLEHIDEIQKTKAVRIQELPLALCVLNREGKKREEVPKETLFKEEDFPLAITAEGERFLRHFHLDELQPPQPDESAADILARIGTILSVWHGEHRSMEESIKYFNSISLWGPGHSADLEKAKCATFLIFYLGPDYRTSVDIYERTFQQIGTQVDKEIALERAKCAINLVFSCGASGNTDMAIEYFHKLSSMKECRDDPVFYAKAALNLITALASKGQCDEAQKIYDSVLEWGSGWAVKIVRLKAIRCLIHYYGKAGRLREAMALFKSMERWEAGDDQCLLQSKVAVFLMEVLEKHKDLVSAREVYASLRWKKGYLEEDLNHLVAARSIINLALSHDDYIHAFDIYRSHLPGGEHELLDLERGRLAVNLILALGKKEMLKQARIIFNSMETFSRTKEMELLMAKAAVNYVAACEAAGDPKKAHAVYDKLEYKPDNLLFSMEKAKAAVTLVGLYGKLGLPQKGRDIYYAMPKYDDPEYKHLKQSAGVNLVTAFAMADRWAEALDSAIEVVGDGMTGEMREELLKKLNFIMSKAINYPRKEDLSILGLFSED